MRRFIRHPSDIPIRYYAERTAEPVWNRLQNVSYGGLCFIAPRAVQLGARIYLVIPVDSPAFEVRAVVVWCAAMKNDIDYQIGVSFENEQTHFAARMVEQVCYIEEYRRKQVAEGRSLSSEQAAQEWVERYAEGFPSAVSVCEQGDDVFKQTELQCQCQKNSDKQQS
ncbi:MAG: PilZ domain-containing protein [Gammaproteobacteria bacterium]|nr:PilZ domain-containing protein [Gammaproteobacteria bacterium]